MMIDALGKECPIPVIMAKKELDAGCVDLTMTVDNRTAVENLTRLASSKGMQVTTEEKGGNFHVRIFGAASEARPVSVPEVASCGPEGSGYAVFISKDHLGEGAAELGYNLIKMALYTFSQSDDIPAFILFMNSGVKLPSGDEKQIIDSLNDMIGKGCEVLVCGACLNYYGLSEQLKVGTVSNMYDILGRMKSASKTITL